MDKIRDGLVHPELYGAGDAIYLRRQVLDLTYVVDNLAAVLQGVLDG